MNKISKFLSLDFLPRNVDLGLLVLRVWLGVSMFWLHGMQKAVDYKKLSKSFPDPIGVGHQVSYALAVFGEVICPALLVLGWFARLGALGSAVTMGVAFFLVHNAALTGRNNGEMAFIYMAGFVTLLLTGPGRYSLEGGKSGGGSKRSSEGSPRPKKSAE